MPEGEASASGARADESPEQAARSHLQSAADLYRLSSTDVSGAELRGVHDTGSGAIIATFAQRVRRHGGVSQRSEGGDGSGNNDLVALSGYLAPTAW